MYRTDAVTPTVLARYGVVAFLACCLAACGVSRNAAYKTLLAQYASAPRRDMAAEGWDFEVPVQKAGVVARVAARPGMDAIRISYSDESAPRKLYDYVDYSSVVDVRVDGTTLYVYWVESLLSSKHQLIAFDLQARRVISRRQVDPTDIAQR